MNPAGPPSDTVPTAGWTDYDQHARTRPRDDLWGQVRRTVGGKPVPDAQIAMIIAAVKRQLCLEPADTVLDLACGNGALSHQLFSTCAASVGVDISEYLIGVAVERFQTQHHRFVVDDATTYVEQAPDTARFTKVLCYGSFAYFSDQQALRLLRALQTRFPRVTHVVLGNLPDPARATEFYRMEPAPDLHAPQSAIGSWRDMAQIHSLAGPGWQLDASVMPEPFFARHYRFDLLLRRLA